MKRKILFYLLQIIAPIPVAISLAFIIINLWLLNQDVDLGSMSTEYTLFVENLDGSAESRPLPDVQMIWTALWPF